MANSTSPVDAFDPVAFAANVEAVGARLRALLVGVRSPAGGGSGTVWGADGVIVTNNHVVPGNEAAVVLPGRRDMQAHVVRRDASLDLALLRVEAGFEDVAEPRGAADVRVGELAFAIGNPWGQDGVLTRGIVVARGPVSAEAAVPLPDAIRADVGLAPGNSGGPLADAAGRVIGINSMIVGGMAVAIPADLVERFVAGDSRPLAYLGISGRGIPLPPAIAASYGASDGRGLLLTDIEPGSPASDAGLIPGDVILRLDQQPGGLAGISRHLRAMRAGRRLTADFLRDTRVIAANLEPVERPAA